MLQVLLLCSVGSVIFTMQQLAYAVHQRKWLFVEPMNGLANRLRAIASARALAQLSSRTLVIVWKIEVECNISLTRLIEVPEKVIHSYKRGQYTHVRYYNNPRDVININADYDIYIRTPFVINADVNYDHYIYREFQTMRPTQQILQMVNDLKDSVGKHEIAVHVRMLDDIMEDVPGLNNESQQEFEKYVSPFRTRCHWSYFVDLLRYIGASQRNLTIDSDTPRASLHLQHALGNGKPLAGTCFGPKRQQTHCIEVAFAHMLFMARASTLILSYWSSYSELVRWFAPPNHIAFNGCEYAPERREWVMTSIIVACHNRDTVSTLIDNTLAVTNNTTELVVVDWSSTNEISRRHVDRRVRIVRVDGVRAWNLAQAYNVALRYASGKRVLKIDCDTRLSCMPDPPQNSMTFLTGNWKSAGNLNGIVYVSRNVLESVGGYDERLSQYGWDDNDLYQRIEKFAQLKRHDINTECIQHISHANYARGVRSNLQGLIMTQQNRLCVDSIPWNKTFRVSSYRSVYNEDTRIVQVWKPKPIEKSSHSCDERLAVAIVLFKLFSQCKSNNCKHLFWKISKGSWNSPFEFMVRLVPTYVKETMKCAREWPMFDDPSQVQACASVLTLYDKYLRERPNGSSPFATVDHHKKFKGRNVLTQRSTKSTMLPGPYIRPHFLT